MAGQERTGFEALLLQVLVMTSPQELHRAVPLLLQRDGVRNIDDASKIVAALRLQVFVTQESLSSRASQAALLTVIAAGRRTFQGGVSIAGLRPEKVRTALSTADNLVQAAIALGAELRTQPLVGVPTIVIGDSALDDSEAPNAVRIRVSGWMATVAPVADHVDQPTTHATPLAGVAAAGIALSEVFSAHFGLHPEAGQRSVSLDLWPAPSATATRPASLLFPGRLRLVGLGHLGQAYVWALTAILGPVEGEVVFELQDADLIGTENLSTCLLATQEAVGTSKARVVGQWLERRGIMTRIIERRFLPGDQFSELDPELLIVGVDSPLSRANIAAAAQQRPDLEVIDVGLGSGRQDFDEIVLHSSPFSPSDIERWRKEALRTDARVQQRANEPGFMALAVASGLDRCGSVQLAEISAGVPFVGVTAAAITVAEVVRRLSGNQRIHTSSYRMRDLSFGIQPHFGSSVPTRMKAVTLLER